MTRIRKVWRWLRRKVQPEKVELEECRLMYEHFKRLPPYQPPPPMSPEQMEGLVKLARSWGASPSTSPRP